MNDYPRVIGITGRARAGKDTLGAYLVENYGYTRWSFASAVKELALRVDPLVPVDSLGGIFLAGNWRLSTLVKRLGWEQAKDSEEIRRFLQELGTGVRDLVDSRAWIKVLDRKTEEWAREQKAAGIERPRITVTDVRFLNEAHSIQRAGGKIWRVLRVNNDGTLFDNGVRDHESESQVDQIKADYDISAPSGELQALYSAADFLLEGYRNAPVL